MMEMLGEMEPTVPNTRRQKQTESKINPVTGERIPRYEARQKPVKKERVKSKKEIKKEREAARQKSFWENI